MIWSQNSFKQEDPQMLEVLRSKATLETITPSMAAVWLRNNVSNRRVTPLNVKEYARAMTEHRWRVNGETIKISTQGNLIDGQHRLMACIQADCEFKSYVIMGIDNDTFDTVDIGKKRTAGDILGIEQCRNADTVAASIRWIKLFRSGLFQMANVKMPPDEIRLFLAAEPQIEESVSRIQGAKKVMLPGLAGALHYLFTMKDAAAADLFFVDLATGSNLVPGDPILVLREKLIKEKINKAKLPKSEIAAICIRAWNHRRQRNTGTIVLKGSIVGADGQRSFPEIA